MADNRIQALVDQIYHDGMDKAARDAESLLNKAEREADRILDEARKSAQQIVQAAEQRCESIERSTAADLKLAAGQAISHLRQSVQDLVASRVLEESVAKVALDSAFLKELLLEIARVWFADPAREARLEVDLPESLRERAQIEFAAGITGALNELELRFSPELNGGFRIARRGDSFQVDFSDQALIEFFKPYLKRKTAELFFSEQEAAE